MLRHDGALWERPESGQPLRKKGLLLGVRGDWDFFNKQLGLPNWKATRCCWWCVIEHDHLGSGQIFAELSSNEFFQWCLGKNLQVAPLFELPGVSTATVLVDWLHAVELGISQDATGNVLWHYLHKDGVMPVAGMKEKLVHLNDKLKAFYAELKPSNRIGRLTLKMIKSPGMSPKLKTKGAEARALRPWIKMLAEELVQHEPDEAHIQMLCCIDALVACSAAVDLEPFNLDQFQRTGDAFLQSYEWLSFHFHEQGLWKYKPKHHMFYHLLYTVAPRHGSPHNYWCWQDESLGGLFAKAAKRRGGRANSSFIAKSLMSRVSSLAWVQ